MPERDEPTGALVRPYAVTRGRTRPKLEIALEALVEPTTREDGYVNYDLHQADDDPAVFYFYENWESEAALDAHLSTPHLEQFKSVMDDLLDERGLTIARLRRIA